MQDAYAEGRLEVRKLLYSCNLPKIAKDPFAPQVSGMLPEYAKELQSHTAHPLPFSDKC